MSGQQAAEIVRQPSATTGIVDCDIHPVPRSRAEIAEFLPERWRRHLAEYGQRLKQPLIGTHAYPKSQPALSRRDAWPPSGGPPGSDLEFVQMQHLDPYGIAYGILQPLAFRGMDERNPEFAPALSRAVNEWQVAHWTSRDARLRASITLPGEDAALAIAELEHWAGHPHFAQVALVTRACEPLGHRRYWPIYEAAERLGLPLGLHSVGTNGYPTGAGWPSFYYEEHQAAAMTITGMVASMVLEGVFHRFPGLRVVAIEGGFAWVPSLSWRMDRHWEVMRSEIPHVPRPPSEYVRENIWFTTQPVEEPDDPEDLRRIMTWIGWDRMLFSTDYPHWDSDDPRYAFKFVMTEAERDAIFSGNARSLYGLA